MFEGQQSHPALHLETFKTTETSGETQSGIDRAIQAAYGPTASTATGADRTGPMSKADHNKLAHELGVPASTPDAALQSMSSIVAPFRMHAAETAIWNKIVQHEKGLPTDASDEQKQVFFDKFLTDPNYRRDVLLPGHPHATEAQVDKALGSAIKSELMAELPALKSLHHPPSNLDITKAIMQHQHQEEVQQKAKVLGLPADTPEPKVQQAYNAALIETCKRSLGPDQSFTVPANATPDQILAAYNKAAQAQLFQYFQSIGKVYPKDMTPAQAATAVNAELEQRWADGKDRDIDYGKYIIDLSNSNASVSEQYSDVLMGLHALQGKFELDRTPV